MCSPLLWTVRRECLRIVKNSLFNLSFNKSVKLEDFEQVQSQYCSQMTTALKDKYGATAGLVSFVPACLPPLLCSSDSQPFLSAASGTH